MNNYKIGSCCHLVIDYVCTHGTHQNYPCPYKGDFTRCKNFVQLTQKMIDDINIKGYYTIPIK